MSSRTRGREWRPQGQPVATRTHDFPGDSVGKAVPYGIYGLTVDAGWASKAPAEMVEVVRSQLYRLAAAEPAGSG